MNIHEFQAKEILRKYGVPLLQGGVARSPEEAAAVAARLGGTVVVKAQIHAGGRGKAGGVKVVASPEKAAEFARGLLGKPLVTHQTGPDGRVVRQVLVESGCDIARELYLGVVVDRATGKVGIIASPDGGVEIEEVAAKTPERIFHETIDPTVGFAAYQGRRLAFRLGLPKELVNKAVGFFAAVTRAFHECDASMVEINPLVVTKGGELIALDAKVSLDDNALFRHADLREYRDVHEEDPRETEAAKYDLSYIALSGNIGCMVNGAGLAMATMDIVKHAGGEPANFLDVGGGADQKKVAEAFRILLSDASVRAIFINVFGGILRCDVFAEGVVAAAKEVGLSVPLVVRMEGTNVERGKEILKSSGLAIEAAGDMAEGARLAVAAAARGAGASR
ncbi:MAG: succinate--CoA ligase subunit beta [Polyangiaceae bacterium UTPRO1]|nr:ADP-forming succinate--CoA ligase subunit beta [Myxococcales bacterium]OQY66951.1 MAG: succinate--CoA ligase subunit beta [Polyangiaceae bacterium UTPRO1]